jgi:hypothetical protein
MTHHKYQRWLLIHAVMVLVGKIIQGFTLCYSSDVNKVKHRTTDLANI